MRGLSKFFIGAVIGICLIGCVPQEQYRKRSENGYFMAVEQRCTPRTEAGLCETAEEHKEPPYFLGIVEFDDSGLLYDIGQLDFVIKQIQDRGMQAPNHPGAIVIAFAHGWTHNASPDDDSLKYFRSVLADVARREKSLARDSRRTPRLVAGVYLGWHGHSMRKGFEQIFTFFPRKSTAHRIGEREATQALLRLRDTVYGARNNQRDKTINRFIIVGHSFGAALVYSAISQLLSQQLLCQTTSSQEEKNRLADSVILINPAIEAVRVLPLMQTVNHNQSCKNDGSRRSYPQLAIFTSDTDLATKTAFPLAGFTSTIWKKLFGISYGEGMPNPVRSRPAISEQDADSRSIGHYDALVTHFLVPSDSSLSPMGSAAGCQKASERGLERRLRYEYRQGLDHLDFGDTCLVVADPKYANYVSGFERNLDSLRKRRLAIFNVKMDPQIWDGHGLEQTNQRKYRFLGFLKTFIPFSVGEDDF